MNLGFSQPGWLWLAPLVLLPWWRSVFTAAGFSSIRLAPADGGSQTLEYGLRLAGILAFAGLILGLAGLHRRESTVERVGRGTHIVLLLDRSRSMDDSFAGRTPSGVEESKSAAAVRFLEHFVAGRPHDRIGVAAFSTGPLYVLPLTDDRAAVAAALRAARLPGLAQTQVAKGLALALSHYAGTVAAGARSILLVSDGAAVIEPQSEVLLRRWFLNAGVRLYWIFLRTAGSHGLFEPPVAGEDSPADRPELYLHRFFEGLGIPYRAYEAENPDALQRALDEVDRQENRSLRYTELQPREDWRGACFGIATAALSILALAKALETSPWKPR